MMTTLSLHTPVLPRAKFGGFGRLLGTALSAIDIFAEAQQMADEGPALSLRTLVGEIEIGRSRRV
jgi:hypothetical protein